MLTRINLGSGQRRFEGHGWINLDCVSRPPDQVPDVVCDVLREPIPYHDVDLIALVHVAEHWLLHDGVSVFRKCWDSLRPGGSLIIVVPDIKALAKAWLRGEIVDYIYIVNLMGAWQNEPGDSHRWHWTKQELNKTLREIGFQCTMPFDWRVMPGAESLVSDWWYYGIEAVK